MEDRLAQLSISMENARDMLQQAMQGWDKIVIKFKLECNYQPNFFLNCNRKLN